MASRTGLIPVKTRNEVRTKWNSAIPARKSIQAAPSNKTGLSNIKRTQTTKPVPRYKHELASKKSVGSLTSIMPKNVPLAANKALIKPTLVTKNNVNMRKSYPGFTSVDKCLPKQTSSRRSFMPGQRTPKSILKKEPDIFESGKKSAQALKCPDSNHVKFRSKATDQASMRAKLNAWLESKGKAPSACHYRHMLCFGAEVSAQKKKDVLVDRTLNQSCLSQQVNANNNESAKKRLFNEESKSPQNIDKENVASQDDCCNDSDDTVDNSVRLVPEDSNHAMTEETLEDPSETQTGPSLSPFQKLMMEKVLQKIESILEECLHLFETGCPLENILPWFTEMEKNMPETRTFATYYVYKAKVLAAFPHMVLDVFCEAIENGAQPGHLLAEEMRNYFSNWLSFVNESSKTETVGVKKPSHSLKLGHFGTESIQNTDTVQSKPNSSESNTVVNKRGTSASALGSTVKYKISVAKPLVKDTTVKSTVAVVTPVRRSFRLSGKPTTPGSHLRREVNSVSDLSSMDRRSMLFAVNPAITVV